ncbi:YebC/PmpR family DNA-binding transcriptional regulator [bacterium]|nr:YebC/PmpR family DNA-binding transcriptional regulator [bacterium]
MAGHSKWKTIKHKKAATDAKRGKIFSKLVREIVMAARMGGGDPAMNTRLRLALQKGKDANMPQDNIKRAIEKGVGGGDGEQMVEVTYEAYGPNGVALIIDTLTDNKNRTVPNLRCILSKGGGSMANNGAVSYMFDTKGLLLFEPGVSEDQIMELATEAGAEDIDIQEDGSIEVLTEQGDFEAVRLAIETAEIPFLEASITKLPQTTVDLDADGAQQIINLIDSLEDDDDVQTVYGNHSISDEIMEAMGE